MHLLSDYVQQFGRFQRNARLYLISNGLSGVTAGILLVLYNLYLVSLGYNADFIGVILFVGILGAGLAIFPAGWCIDRFSGKAILIWSSILIGLAGVGLILFRQPIPLGVSAFIAGLSGAFLLVVNAPFLTANSTPDERPHLFSLNIVLSLVTIVLGKVIGGVLPLWFRAIPELLAPPPSWAAWILATQPGARSYQLALLFAGIIAAPSMIPLFLLSNDRPANRGTQGAQPSVRGPGGRAVAKSLMGAFEGALAHRPPDGVPQPGQAPGPIRPTPPLPVPTAGTPGNHPGGVPQIAFFLRGFDIRRIQIRTVLHSPIFLLALTQAFIGLGAGLFIPYFNIYFVQHLHASSALFGLIDGGATATTALFTLVAPWLAIRLGKVNTIALTQLASIPPLLTIGLTNILPLTALLYLLRYGLMDMSAGIFQVFSMEAVSEEHRGLANSTYQAAFQVPWALTTPLGGLIIVHLGYPPIFIAAAACYLLSIAILWGNFGRGKGLILLLRQPNEQNRQLIQEGHRHP